MNTYAILTEDSQAASDATSLWVAERLCGLMATHDVPSRQQAALLGDLCGLSPSQARRKLRGALWSFNEVLAIVNHFDASLDEVFTISAPGDVAQIDAGSEPHAAMQQDAMFLMDPRAVPCRVRIGAKVVAEGADGALLTAESETGWVVGSAQQLASQQVLPPYFQATQIVLTPLPSESSIRVAILDDDPGTAETLADWFNASGYAAQAFTSGDQLLTSGVESHDAFIVDFMLAASDSSQTVIKAIRQTLPVAPVLLLTGKLRSGEISESDLVTMLRSLNLSYFEKPVRPSVLAATIEKELDRLAEG